MLVLSRKLEEEIVIDGRIRVKVVAINGNRVKLAFEAPHDVIIQRAELRRTPEPAPAEQPAFAPVLQLTAVG